MCEVALIVKSIEIVLANAYRHGEQLISSLVYRPKCPNILTQF